MKATCKSPDVLRYDAEHCFMNEKHPDHDLVAAGLAWHRMIAFGRSSLCMLMLIR
ncbi:hypothetical protein IF803_40165 [Bradyrhizobium sp. UFLA06-06]